MAAHSKDDSTVIQRVLLSSALALESTMHRLRRLKDGEPPQPAAPNDGSVESQDSVDVNGRVGRIEHDSRGSAVWNWALETGASALDTTQRLLKRLEAPSLTLDEKTATATFKRPVVERDTGGGYDPYNCGKPVRKR